MLKTALKPRWIAALLLALILATVFVLLSQWQFSASHDAAPPPPAQTETVRPLTGVLAPAQALLSSTADQMVSFTGRFEPAHQVLISNRLRDGVSGYWVVTAFDVDGVQPANVIPVVRGWVKDAAAADTAPAGEASVVGRLLPTEAPIPGQHPPGQAASLSVAELINSWNTPSYAAFVADAKVTVSGAGQPASALQPVVVGPQPQTTPVNWLNIFYAVEWIVFAGFAFFLWWRLVADDYRRSLEEAEDYPAETDEVST